MVFFRKQFDRYFDSGSFTPVHPKAYAAMRSVLRKQRMCRLGNPSSAHHYGTRAQVYVTRAQETVAKIYRCKPSCVQFTSGATEANLVAVRSALLRARAWGQPLSDMHILIGGEEHSSVQRVVSYFKTLGASYSTVVTETGRRLSPSSVARHLQKNTVCVSLQYVNSMHGLLQPIAQIADACRLRCPSVFVHTDAAQATAYLDCSPESLRVDAVTVDSTKAFGPQGSGALVFRSAGQLAGLSGLRDSWDIRPGTPSVAAVYGFSVALSEAHRYRERNTMHVRRARALLVEHLTSFAPDAYVHGLGVVLREVASEDLDSLAPHLLYVSFRDTQHAYLAALLDARGFAVSTASACSDQTDGGLRIGLLPSTGAGAVRSFAQCLHSQLPFSKSV